MRGTFIALAFWLAMLPGFALAQQNPTLSEAERGIRRDAATADATRLRIEEMQVDAHIVGRTAQVTLELLIGTDAGEPYEGNLTLMLPADAVVTGYALDVEGTLIPGKLLEAPKARNLYEDEVRAGIDPGLAEVTGNTFTTRIFPIDARHPRRFRMTFAAAFDPVAGFHLPLARDTPIGTVAARVMIDGYPTPPSVRFAGETIRMDRTGDRWTGDARAKSALLRDGLQIAGAAANPLVIAKHGGGERFFLIDDAAGVDAAPRKGGRLRIYWDRSVSHRDAQPDLERDVLARLIGARAPSAIDLVTFASDRPTVATVAGVAGLQTALGRLTYRGATSLEGLDALRLAPARDCILVSDGQVTIDRGARFAPDCRLMVLTAAPGADSARLGRIAQASGGAVIRVAPGSIAQAVAALSTTGIGVIAVRDSTGRRVDARTRSLPAAAGRWLIVGRMPATGGVRLLLGDGTERSYASDRIVTADAPGALWAQQAVADLADDPAAHTAMADLARTYSIAGPGMSFLVLERPDQYLRAGLAPPDGFSKRWLAEYRTAKIDDDRQKVEAKGKRLADVVERWRERREWWNRRFTPGPRVRPVKQVATDGSIPSPPPAPMEAPPPPPPPAPAPVAAAEDDSADIVVTATRARQSSSAMANAITRVESPRPAPADRPGTGRPIALDVPDLLAERPYLAALDAAAPAARLTVLTEQERAYGTLPTFYLDVAEWFRLKDSPLVADALLLSALDLPTSDDETRQIVAFRLERDRHHDRAVELAEHLAAANAQFRPQPGRSLALALAARGRATGPAGRADLERAFALLTRAALDPASEDFNGIDVVALMEANALIPAIEAAGGTWTLDKRLVGLLDTDARIVIEWTADDADIDLWVDEPNGERVYYGDKLSSSGGQISNDMTDGYGPEEYAIRRAPVGAYRVRINGFDADRINPNGSGHVLIRLTRNFARSGEEQVLVDADLAFQTGRNRDDDREIRAVATLRVSR